MTHKLPEITESKIVARSRLFEIEELSLTFSNGATRQFERIRTYGYGAVLIVPMIDDQHLFLVREYVAGLHRYELSFPKGLINQDESPEDAANRELQEEIGYSAKKVESIATLTSAPGYFTTASQVILARDLSPSVLPGDEPEPIEAIKWNINNISELLARDDFCHAGSIAAIFLVREHLKSVS